jgi:hypothetical protein
MARTPICICLAVVFALSAVAAFAQFPISKEQGYAGYQAPDDSRAVSGIKPAMTVGQWLLDPRTLDRAPQRPWLKVKVDGRMTPLGPETWTLGGALMMPVTAAYEFGLTATCSPLNMNLMTLSGGKAPIVMMVGSKSADVGEKTVTLEAAPRWHNGKVYMPVESIGGALGWTFEMEKMTGTLSINTPTGAGAAQAQSQVGTPGLTSVASESETPTLKIVNKAGQEIVVAMEHNAMRQMWTLEDGETVSAGKMLAGEYRYAIGYTEIQLVTGTLRLEGKRAYTWNIAR